MKKLIETIKTRYRNVIFKLFLKVADFFLTDKKAIAFSEKVMRIKYINSFFPVKEIEVKKGKIKYTLLVSGNGRVYNLGRHDTREVVSQRLAEIESN